MIADYGGIRMRYYSVSFRNNLVWMFDEKTENSKDNFEKESDEKAGKTALEKLKEELAAISGVEAAEVTDNGHVIGIEAAEEDYPAVMNQVVNLYRRFDDSSIVTYDFQLNM